MKVDRLISESRKKKWTILFLSITALAIALEIYASIDSNPDTVPWTWLIVDNVPDELTYSIIAFLIFWVPFHFYRRYKKKNYYTWFCNYCDHPWIHHERGSCSQVVKYEEERRIRCGCIRYKI